MTAAKDGRSGRSHQEAPARRQLFRSAMAGAAALTLPGPGTAADAATTGSAARPSKLSFAFIGDLPYSRLEEAALKQIYATLPVDELAFMIHIGDIKARRESCDDGTLTHRLGLLDASPLPLIYTPGDNEWTDCRLSNGDPLETARAWSDPLGPGGRLRWVREHAFMVDRTLGRRTLPVQRQGRTTDDALAPEPRLPENLRWQVAGIQFCTLHIIGGDNGLDGVAERARRSPFGQLAYDDWAARQQANARWLFETIEQAEQQNAAALAIAIHANLRFGRGADDGYSRMRELIAQAANRFRRPMLLLHGDTHLYRIGRPLAAQGLPHLLQVECFGSPFVSSWLRIDWDPARVDAPDGPFLVSAHHG